MARARCPFCPDEVAALRAANVRLRTVIEAKYTEIAAPRTSLSGAAGMRCGLRWKRYLCMSASVPPLSAAIVIHFLTQSLASRS